MAAHLQVEGLKEFRKALRAAAATMPREIKRSFDEVAGIIVEDVIPHMEGSFVGPTTGRLVGSVRALSTQTEGRVVVGNGSSVPYAGWWEFGGQGHPNPRPRRWVREGRTLYPALRRKEAQVREALEMHLARLNETIEANDA